MRNFDYRELTGRSWDSEIIGLVAQIHMNTRADRSFI